MLLSTSKEFMTHIIQYPNKNSNNAFVFNFSIHCFWSLLMPKKKKLINSAKSECQMCTLLLKLAWFIQMYLLDINSFKNSTNKV
jgi:hypothetical protein